MIKKREAIKIISGVTMEQYHEAMSIYARSDNRADRLIAQMNIEVAHVHEKYDPELLTLMAEKEQQGEIIRVYCTEHKQELFAAKRRIYNVHGSVGFRLGTPKLKTLPKWTWDKVLEKVKVTLPDFVRTYEEVDKESIIASRNDEKVAPYLNDLGLCIAQDEIFYIELKKEEAFA